MAFDAKRIDTLQLKFNRHKITFEYDSIEEKLIIGKSKNTIQKLLIAIILIIVAILTMTLIAYLKLPLGRLVNYIITGGIAALGFKQLSDYYSLKKK